MTKAKKSRSGNTITVEQYRSGICTEQKHRRTLRALGLRRMWKQVQLPDNPSVRGMIAAIPHLVRVVPAESVKGSAGNGGK